MIFNWLLDIEKQSLREENAQLRKELTEIRQQELMRQIVSNLWADQSARNSDRKR